MNINYYYYSRNSTNAECFGYTHPCNATHTHNGKQVLKLWNWCYNLYLQSAGIITSSFLFISRRQAWMHLNAVLGKLDWLLLTKGCISTFWAKARDQSEMMTNKGNHKVILWAADDINAILRSIMPRNCLESHRGARSLKTGRRFHKRRKVD